MSEPNKDQHYVPKFYLKRFTKKSTSRFSVYDKESKKLLENQNPRNFAARRYYYDIENEIILGFLSDNERKALEERRVNAFNDSHFIEHYLDRVESDIAVVFNSIEKNPSLILNTEIQSKISIFLHLLVYRVDSYREQTDSLMRETNELLKKLPLSEDELKGQKEKLGLTESAKENQIRHLISTSSVLKTGLQLFENYNWYYGLVENPISHLVTSDNPAFQLYLGFNDICFPISPDTALVFRIKDPTAPLVSYDKPKDHIIMLSPRSVAVYNIIQETNARRFLFGNSEDLRFLIGINRIQDILKTSL